MCYYVVYNFIDGRCAHCASHTTHTGEQLNHVLTGNPLDGPFVPKLRCEANRTGSRGADLSRCVPLAGKPSNLIRVDIDGIGCPYAIVRGLWASPKDQDSMKYFTGDGKELRYRMIMDHAVGECPMVYSEGMDEQLRAVVQAKAGAAGSFLNEQSQALQGQAGAGKAAKKAMGGDGKKDTGSGRGNGAGAANDN